ncbi:MAG: hypothetical protein IKX36_04205 [Prevotella sp.]|nr:hypothetical protein [Prevotella sp.]
MQEKKICPHCGHEVALDDKTCEECQWLLRWSKDDPSVYEVDHVQTTLSRPTLTCFFLLAAIGQIMLFLSTKTLDNLVNQRMMLCFGHVLKMAGETALLYTLMRGLRFEYKRLAILFRVTIVLLIAYHLIAAVLPYIGHWLVPAALRPVIVSVAPYVLIAAEVAYVILGYRILDSYNGKLSFTGLLMALAAVLHLVLNLILHRSGNDIISDAAVAIVTIFYFFILSRRMLDHEAFLESFNKDAIK